MTKGRKKLLYVLLSAFLLLLPYFILTQETWRFKELFFYAKHLLDTQSELGASCILAVQCHFCLTQLSLYEEE